MNLKVSFLKLSAQYVSIKNLSFFFLTEVVSIIIKLLWIVGIDITNPIKFTRRLGFCMFFIFFATTYFINAILMDWPDIKKMLNSSAIMSIAIQCMIRIILYLRKNTHCADCFKSMFEFFERNDDVIHLRKTILKSNTKLLRMYFIYIQAFHLFCLFSPGFMSFYHFFIHGDFITPIPGYLPFIDPSSLLSFVANMTIQITILIIHAMANSAADCIYLVFCYVFKIYLDILECDLNDFDEYLSGEDDNNKSKEKIDKYFVKIVKSHQAIVKFYDFGYILGQQFFVMICFNIFIICFSGISLLTSKYTLCYGLAILYPVQVFFVCKLGSYVRDQNERLMDMMWKFNWYKLSKKSQKDFLFFLTTVQAPIEIKPTFLGVIDMELYTKVSFYFYEK